MGLKKGNMRVPTVVQWVKDLTLQQLWCRLRLPLGFFDPRLRNFHMPWVHCPLTPTLCAKEEETWLGLQGTINCEVTRKWTREATDR